MLIISGSAEFISENERFTKGNRHVITLFSLDENLEQNLQTIETYLNNLGWDEILLEQTESLKDDSNIQHHILQQAYDKAKIQGMSLVAYNDPLACAA